jgi:anti-sigma factor ChrR (cupin superfamily)
MELHTDFSQRVILHTEQMHWSPSTAAGVERHQLDRLGEEVARATSIVSYASGRYFAAHTHGGGEEIFVLEGVFSDEHGHYPPGSYLRNPPRTTHTPFSEPGCVIFVKLWQFNPGDAQTVYQQTEQGSWSPRRQKGIQVQLLHEFRGVRTVLMHLEPDLQVQLHSHSGCEETLVLEGDFADEHGEYSKGSWLRSPPGSSHSPRIGPNGTLLYLKSGHLVAPVLPLPN